MVWKLDRLARSIRQLIETVEDRQARSIELRSRTENVDTATAGGRLVFHLFGALAEFERAVICERTSAGLQAARERGKIGVPPAILSTIDQGHVKVEVVRWHRALSADYRSGLSGLSHPNLLNSLRKSVDRDFDMALP